MTKTLTFSRYSTLFLFLSTLLLITSSPAHAQASLEVVAANGQIAGESKKLVELSERVMALECPTLECRLKTPPTWFTVSAPGQHTMRVRLTRVGFPRNVERLSERSSVVDTSSRPVLLRALATIRHADENGRPRTVPIAGTLFRDRARPILELAIPQIGGRSTPDNLRNIVVRSALHDIAARTTGNARAKRISSSAFRNRSCALHEGLPATSTVRPLSNTQETPPKNSATLKIFYLATDYDSQYSTRINCGSATICKNQILSVVNQAAVYYENQFGATLEVPRQYGPTSISATTNAEGLLDSFSAYNFLNRASVLHTGRNTTSNQVDLFQLYTGKDLDSNVIGLAYVGVMCPNADSKYAAMLVQYLADSVNQIIVAHETGHTLGANHTTDGSGIMGAALSNPVPTSFSEQSVTEISNHTSRYYGECRGGTRDTTQPTATPTPVTTPIPGATATSTPTSGGGGSGSGGNDPKLSPTTLGLQATQARNGLVTITTTATASPLCSITVRAATSGDAAITGKIVAQYSPLSNSNTLQGSVPLRVRTQNRKTPYIYFYAQHTCTDGTILERSTMKKINPNRITVRNARTTTAASWISKLAKVLE
jgi:hypothetical protein